MMKDKITEDLKKALKEGDSVRVSTLRLLSNSLHNEKIDKQRELTEEEEIVIVRRELKQRQEAIEALRQAQGKLTGETRAEDLKERIEKERKEAEILKEFLPSQMPESELSELVNQVIEETGASGPQDFGRVMGAVIAKVAGRADGKAVVEAVRKKLTS